MWTPLFFNDFNGWKLKSINPVLTPRHPQSLKHLAHLASVAMWLQPEESLICPTIRRKNHGDKNHGEEFSIFNIAFKLIIKKKMCSAFLVFLFRFLNQKKKAFSVNMNGQSRVLSRVLSLGSLDAIFFHRFPWSPVRKNLQVQALWKHMYLYNLYVKKYYTRKQKHWKGEDSNMFASLFFYQFQLHIRPSCEPRTTSWLLRLMMDRPAPSLWSMYRWWRRWRCSDQRWRRTEHLFV